MFQKHYDEARRLIEQARGIAETEPYKNGEAEAMENYRACIRDATNLKQQADQEKKAADLQRELEREHAEEERAKADAERIAFANGAPAVEPKPTLRDKWLQWERNGRSGKFQVVLLPDYAADYREAGNKRVRVSYRHDDRPLEVEGVRYYLSDGVEARSADTRSVKFTGGVERRTDIVTTDTATVYSGYLVPARTMAQLAWHENAASGVLKAGPTIIHTPDDATIYWPTFDTDAAALKGSEGSAATVTNPVLGRKELGSYRRDGFFSVSNEMLRSSILNFEDVLSEAAARAIATYVCADLAAGDGSGDPQGLGGANTTTVSGKTTAATTSFTVDELMELKLSVLPVSRMNGTWLFGSTAYLNLWQLRDGVGRYLVTPGAAAGEPEMFLGNPIFEEAGYPAPTAGLIPVTFGDVSQYVIRYVGPVVFEASEEFAFTSFETTFRFAKWLDAELMDTAAVKHLTMHS